MALALVAWTALGALRETAGPAAADAPAAAGLAALIGFGLMVSAIGRIPPPWRRSTGSRGRAGRERPARRPGLRRGEHPPGGDVLILGTTLDYRVADRAGVVNVSPLNGVTALVSPAEADRALDQLSDEGGSEVFESVSNAPVGGGFVFKIPELAGILRARGYALVADDPLCISASGGAPPAEPRLLRLPR